MRILLQRVKKASVKVEEKVVGKIERGWLAMVCFNASDNETIVEKMCKKAFDLRCFSDHTHNMNVSLGEVGGAFLCVSQFTLYANARKGRRPSFTESAPAEKANHLYEHSKKVFSSFAPTESGVFGAHMDISLEADGPVSILLDSDEVLSKL